MSLEFLQCGYGTLAIIKTWRETSCDLNGNSGAERVKILFLIMRGGPLYAKHKKYLFFFKNRSVVYEQNQKNGVQRKGGGFFSMHTACKTAVLHCCSKDGTAVAN